MAITFSQAIDPVEPDEGVWTAFRRTGARTCHGFVVDRADPARRFAVEIRLDGVPVGVLRANAYAPEVAQAGLGDGYYGFAYTLPDGLAEAVVVDAVVANLDTPVGSSIDFARTPAELAFAPAGEVRWSGGLLIEGWVTAGVDGEAVTVSLAVDGEAPVRVRADRWQHIGGDVLVPGRAFAAHLPDTYADGVVHEVRATYEGRPLSGSPLTFAAFPTAAAARTALEVLADGGEEGPLSDWLGRLLPRTLPFSAHGALRPPPLPTRPAPSPLAVALLGPDGPEAAQESLIAQSHQRWVAVPGSEDPAPFALDAPSLRAFLAGEASDAVLVVFAPASFVLEPDAFDALDAAMAAEPGAVLIYGDFIAAGDGLAGRSWPVLLPAFDAVRLIEQGYCTLVFAARREAVLAALADDPRTSLDLFFRVLAPRRDDDGAVVHLPRVLGTADTPDDNAFAVSLRTAVVWFLAKTAPKASVAPGPAGWFPALRVRRLSESTTTVSVIVPTRDAPEALAACLASLARCEAVQPYEIVIADAGSRSSKALADLARLEAEGRCVVRAGPAPSRAALLNAAAARASGDLLVFLDGHAVLEDPGALAELADHLTDPHVGAAGPLIRAPDGVVLEGGLVLSAEAGARAAFTDHLADEPGYTDLLRVARRCAAVSDLCLMIPRALFSDLGGFDATRFPGRFADVDLCLRLAERGRHVVWSPHARVIYNGILPERTGVAVESRALEVLQARWGALLSHDPFYHPGLNAIGAPYSGLDAGARARSPRLTRLTDRQDTSAR